MAVKVMTKAQLVSLIAEKMSITKASANSIRVLIADTAVTETKKNGQFIILGIGKLVKSPTQSSQGQKSSDRRCNQDTGKNRCEVSRG